MEPADLAKRNSAATIGDLDAMVPAIAELAPEQGATSFPVGDGRAVFFGPGLFVNRLLGFGLTANVQPDDLDTFEQLCAKNRWEPSIDVWTHADPKLALMLSARGYAPDDEVVALCRTLDGPFPTRSHRVEVVSQDTLDEWCDGAAVGWGHDGTERRRGSDLYGRAAFRAQRPGLLLARPFDDQQVSGCAALAVVGDTAILGGMSTLPDHRRTGVQTTMISARLEMAVELGCSLATTQAEACGDSLRNLLRHGFVEVGRITNWTTPLPLSR